jgi:phosphopantetheine--protein transferase-like protein
VALTSWARAEKVSLRGALIDSGEPFSVRQLLAPEAQVPVAAPTPAGEGIVQAHAHAGGMIGIDIEDVASLPEADDYRVHPFYRDNFTPAEISYCVRQGNPRASLCGVWAAKEAILKSGMAGAALSRLIDIEILWDEFGRPGFANCAISISHTGQAAVAVCLCGVQAVPLPTPALPLVAEMPMTVMPGPADGGGSNKRRVMAAGGMVLVAVAAWVLYQHVVALP